MVNRIGRPWALLALFAGLLLSTASAAAKIDQWVERGLEDGTEQEFFVVLEGRADVQAAARDAEPGARTKRVAAVRDALRDHATRTQAPLRDWLDRRGIAYQSFHIVNALLVRGGAALMREIGNRPDVARIEGNPRIRVTQPVPELHSAAVLKAIEAIEPGINATNAPALWAQGFTGQGVIVGSQDTGVMWTHAALKNQYLGWNGATADHNYHWHDSIHSRVGGAPPTNLCGYNAAVPCDDGGHGTHTVGTAVGNDGGSNQVGVAPGARWIACRNMDQGVGQPSTYLECFEWFLAPYPVGGTTAQGDPAKAPHVTINSWGCPTQEGCSALTLLQAVEAQRAAGIMTVVSAGNGGPSCNTVDDPPAIYDAAYSVAAYSSATNTLAAFSSRGLVSIDGSSRMKPDITAPGVNVRSSYPTSPIGPNSSSTYASLSGTSMAGPHVVGAVALLWSARPALKGNIAATENALNAGAHQVPLGTTTCGTIGTPNALWGYGLLDATGAMNALSGALSVTKRGTGQGTVTSNPAGIACGPTCTAQFTTGQQVSLTATPDGSSVFTGWQGACTGMGVCNVAAAAASTASATFAPSTIAPLRLDIDVNGSYDALTDGLMMIRYLFGLSSSAIVNGTIGPGASLAEGGIFSLLENMRPLFDVDGNGQADALTDGLMLIRYQFGLRGSGLTAGAVGPGATRTSPADIEAYIGSLQP